jgi:ABC-type uncharacterized transport system permease subunit
MKIWQKIEPLVAVLLGLVLGLAFSYLAGESPLTVLKVLVSSAVGSGYNLGMTLFYAMPLALTGLSVSIAFRAGLFNIGAEGQLTLGALSTAAVGILFPNLPAPVAVPLAALAGVMTGAVWGGLAGVLRAYRGSHEVITTIMLNFVAAALASYVTLYLLKNPEVQNPETLAVAPSYLVDRWEIFQGAPLGWGFVVVIVVLGLTQAWMTRSARGFEMLAVGDSQRAARVAGISVERTQVLAMLMAGGFAGLVGFLEILGNSGKFRPAFSPDYGFMGIAVALLGRARPLGVLLAALLFGALHKGSVDLDFETENVTRDISKVIQACVIFVVCAEALWASVRNKIGGRAES